MNPLWGDPETSLLPLPQGGCQGGSSHLWKNPRLHRLWLKGPGKGQQWASGSQGHSRGGSRLRGCVKRPGPQGGGGLSLPTWHVQLTKGNQHTSEMSGRQRNAWTAAPPRAGPGAEQSRALQPPWKPLRSHGLLCSQPWQQKRAPCGSEQRQGLEAGVSKDHREEQPPGRGPQPCTAPGSSRG